MPPLRGVAALSPTGRVTEAGQALSAKKASREELERVRQLLDELERAAR